MNQKLVIAEKTSVAQALSKVLGANQRCDGYLEGNGYLESWCVGHLVELEQPDAYDPHYKKWSKEDLPIVPVEWKYNVSSSTKKQFDILKKLIHRDDVASLVCATDAGREGELIFRLVYHQCGCTKPFERLWISSMEDSAIREGFENLRPGAVVNPENRGLLPLRVSDSKRVSIYVSQNLKHVSHGDRSTENAILRTNYSKGSPFNDFFCYKLHQVHHLAFLCFASWLC